MAPRRRLILRDVHAFGRKVSEESFKRARSPGFSIDSELNQGVAKAAVLYSSLHARLYANYLRVAHDAKFKTNRSLSPAQAFLNYLRGGTAESAVAKSVSDWAKMNERNLKADGARSFDPTALDFLNIRLSNESATLLFSIKDTQKQTSLRWVRDEKGEYAGVELFLNEFDKQMAEYSAILYPKDKAEYLKLLQFTAIREGMANRWALRRILPQRGFRDEAVQACGKDLVSFRLPRDKAQVSSVEAYDSLWQEDRYADLMELGKDEAVRASFSNPLLTPDEYGELAFEYLSRFKSFEQGVLAGYLKDSQGDSEAAVTQILFDFAWSYGDYLLGFEEETWSLPPDFGSSIEQMSEQMSQQISEGVVFNGSGVAPAEEVFVRASFPADNLSIDAVADRYADFAYRMRRSYLISGLAYRMQMDRIMRGEVELFYDSKGKLTEINTGKPAYAHPEAFAREHLEALPAIVDAKLEKVAAKWKEKQSARIKVALQRVFGMEALEWDYSRAGSSIGKDFAMGSKSASKAYAQTHRLSEVGRTKNRNVLRQDEYVRLMLPIAQDAVRGKIIQEAAEKRSKEIGSSLSLRRPPAVCPSTGVRAVNAKESSVLKCKTRGLYVAEMAKKPAAVKDPRSYLGNSPFRALARDSGVDAISVPTTPEQLSQFFYKKLDLLTAEKTEGDVFAEQVTAGKIVSNPVVMRGVDLLFSEISGEYSNRTGNRGDELDEATRKAHLEAAIIAGGKSAYRKFVLGMKDPGKYKNPERAAKKSKEIGQELRKKIDAAGSAESDALKGAAPDVKLADLPMSGNSSGSSFMSGLGSFTSAVKSLFSSGDEPTAVASKAAQEAEAKKKIEEREAAKLRSGYFRKRMDRSFERDGGDFFVPEEKDRLPTQVLFAQALALLRVSEEVAGAKSSLRESEWYFPDRIGSIVANERLVKQLAPSLGVLERMSATLKDQQALGQALEQEAIAKAPILLIQPTWARKSEEKEPTLLARLVRSVGAKGELQESLFRKTFIDAIEKAAENDVGKVEAFCRADIKNYGSDDDFRMMFNAVGGLRSSLASNDRIKEWDEQVAKESRSWQHAMMEDYIDPFSMAIFGAIVLVFAWKIILPAMFGVFNATAGAAGFFASTGSLIGQFLGGFGKVGWLALIGDLSPLMMVFSFQTYLMGHTYHYRLPPQLDFSYQVANSRIQNMSLPNVLKRSMVDREKMKEAHEEAASQAKWLPLAYAVDGLGVGLGVRAFRKGVGIIGQKRFAHLSKGSSDALKKRVHSGGLSDLIREKGVKSGLKEYAAKAKQATTTFTRVAAVKNTAEAKAGLNSMLAERLSEVLRDKETLRALYTKKARDMAEQLTKSQAEMKALFPELRIVGDEYPDETRKLLEEVREVVTRKRKEAALKVKGDLDFGVDSMDFYAKIIVRKSYDDALKAKAGLKDETLRRFKDDRKRNVAALLTSAKVDAAKADGRSYLRMLKALEDVPSGSSASETTAFFKSLTQEELEMHRKLLGEVGVLVDPASGRTYRSGFFDAKTRSQAEKFFRDHEYLIKDWHYAGGRARSMDSVLRTGEADFFVGDSGDFESLDPKKYLSAPNEYDVLLLPLPK
jgi:hypothetical protein